jgi:hypothetical protein
LIGRIRIRNNHSGFATVLKRQSLKSTFKNKYPSNCSAPVSEPGRPLRRRDYTIHMRRIKGKCPRFLVQEEIKDQQMPRIKEQCPKLTSIIWESL